MSAPQQYPPTLTADQWADRIRGHLHQSAEHLIAAGVDLLDARAHVAHGDWMPMLARVGIADSTARKLMAIGRHAESFRGNDLPASVGALYELARLDRPQLEAAVEDGRVHGGMTRDEAAALRAADDKIAEAVALREYVAERDAAVDAAVEQWQAVSDHRDYIAAHEPYAVEMFDAVEWPQHDEVLRDIGQVLADQRGDLSLDAVSEFKKRIDDVHLWLFGADRREAQRHTPWRLMPPMRIHEYRALRDDIAEQGVLVPVDVDEDGVVLDGYQRIRACRELGIDTWPTRTRDLATVDDKIAFVFSANMLRVHLTDDQRAFAIAKAEALANGGAA